MEGLDGTTLAAMPASVWTAVDESEGARVRQAGYFEGRKMKDYLANVSDFEKLVAPRLTARDGLLPFNEVQVSRSNDFYVLSLAADPRIRVFPVEEASAVIDQLVDMPHLWHGASFRAVCLPAISGAKHVFGPSFSRAVEIALTEGLVKAKYYLPQEDMAGHPHSLLTHIRPVASIDQGRLVQLEAWEYTPGKDNPNTALYLHCMSPDFEGGVVHLDGASISYSGVDLDTLLWRSEKVLGDVYKKHFRLDGDISIDEMHLIASAFFTSDTLYAESMQIERFHPSGAD
ncbi:TPA: hypothetical protein ACKP7X_001109 [Stenotrophomonas maltophilia]|uniref:hypothetical protein n=2 Tax=Stenotrophomonas TaxID=40323 RepID=UPI0018D40763|nr:hypothetical protein [Stenotrophomonas maltophilia]EMB2830648.1 hypothetical protein [Stenotrophomonas maltophilia]MBH1451968.1 hypothetical protein [Stenotrophomonas maltophilia]MBH1567086.1 hypothetical protein [Stenotrophomonas maltophilia]MBH1728527.1 hypothetical protein [Stenotrophomonas maltophilia]MBN5189528.1 hypothetical protein [Stenotrophomonas maltophilia]